LRLVGLAAISPGGAHQRSDLLPHLLGAGPHRGNVSVSDLLLRVEIEFRGHLLIVLLIPAQRPGACQQVTSAGDEAEVEYDRDDQEDQ
jgi:hypothetical protein